MTHTILIRFLSTAKLWKKTFLPIKFKALSNNLSRTWCFKEEVIEEVVSAVWLLTVLDTQFTIHTSNKPKHLEKRKVKVMVGVIFFIPYIFLNIRQKDCWEIRNCLLLSLTWCSIRLSGEKDSTSKAKEYIFFKVTVPFQNKSLLYLLVKHLRDRSISISYGSIAWHFSKIQKQI